MSDGFQQFYAAYPRKSARKDAEKAWQQIDGDAHLADILAALVWQCQQPSWKERDAAGVLRYVPLPASYLRGERWTDECPPMLRVAVELAETPEQVAARRARVEAESAARFQRERTLAFPERRGA